MKVGIQLYSVRNMMQKDAKLTMKTVADLGYKYIETYCHAMDGFTGSPSFDDWPAPDFWTFSEKNSAPRTL